MSVASETKWSRPEVLPEGVKHIEGNLYRVPLDSILLADKGFNHDGEDIEFTNMRHAMADYQLQGKGFEPEKMTELRESIRTQGLLNNPLCRWHENGTIQAVDCERRVRNIRKLKNTNAQVWDRVQQKWVPASELYATIIVQIDELTDFEAFCVSYAANERAIGHGEGATIQYVKYLRSKGVPDSKIMLATGYNAAWLKDTDKLIATEDDKLLLALHGDEITRTAALRLVEKYPDAGERSKQLFALKGAAQAKHLAAVEKVSAIAAAAEAEAEDAAEIAAAASIVEDFATGEGSIAGGDEDEGELTFQGELDDDDPAIDSEPTTAQATAAEEKADKAKAAKKKVTSQKPKIKKSDVDGDDPPAPKPLTAAKVEKFWWEPCADVLKRNNEDEDGNEIESGIDMRDVSLVKTLCQNYKLGKTEIFKILRAFNRAQEKKK